MLTSLSRYRELRPDNRLVSPNPKNIEQTVLIPVDQPYLYGRSFPEGEVTSLCNGRLILTAGKTAVQRFYETGNGYTGFGVVYEGQVIDPTVKKSKRYDYSTLLTVPLEDETGVYVSHVAVDDKPYKSTLDLYKAVPNEAIFEAVVPFDFESAGRALAIGRNALSNPEYDVACVEFGAGQYCSPGIISITDKTDYLRGTHLGSLSGR